MSFGSGDHVPGLTHQDGRFSLLARDCSALAVTMEIRGKREIDSLPVTLDVPHFQLSRDMTTLVDL